MLRSISNSRAYFLTAGPALMPVKSITGLLIIFSSLSSMIIASLVALRQRKLKRFFAYSSVGHVGYLLVGCSTGTTEGITSMLVYTVIYIVMTLNAWTLILSLELESHGRGTYFTDLRYLTSNNPLFSLLSLLIISLFPNKEDNPFPNFLLTTI